MTAQNTLSQSEFARQAGVSRQAVHQAIDAGRLPADGRRVVLGETGTAKDLWDLTASPATANQARKAQFDEAKQGGSPTPPEKTSQTASSAAAMPGAEPLPTLEKLSAALKVETYKLQKAKAELANIEVDKAAAALVERAEVDFVLADLGALVRSQLEGLPDRLSGQLAAHRGDTAAIHRDLEDAAHTLLTDLADAIKRRTEP
jgi:hypothetical protein